MFYNKSLSYNHDNKFQFLNIVTYFLDFYTILYQEHYFVTFIKNLLLKWIQSNLSNYHSLNFAFKAIYPGLLLKISKTNIPPTKKHFKLSISYTYIVDIYFLIIQVGNIINRLYW